MTVDHPIVRVRYGLFALREALGPDTPPALRDAVERAITIASEALAVELLAALSELALSESVSDDAPPSTTRSRSRSN